MTLPGSPVKRARETPAGMPSLREAAPTARQGRTAVHPAAEPHLWLHSPPTGLDSPMTNDQ
ncbi:MAG TPA: hypothetical protein V6D25_25375 [Leptolyngbyaceae cyanobacterium]